MLNQAYFPVIDDSWISSCPWQVLHLLEQKVFEEKAADCLDDMPVMSSTVLGLDILMHETCIDLQLASELVLNDVGATFQTLRLIDRGWGNNADRPVRIGDCIASLDIGMWFAAISARTFACDRIHSATTAVWKHCRSVAQYAQLIAESLEGIPPEDAYLVGLLHDIGAIPTVLGWLKDGECYKDPTALLAMDASLPRSVLSGMRSLIDDCNSNDWRVILTEAHELAARMNLDPSLSRDVCSNH